MKTLTRDEIQIFNGLLSIFSSLPWEVIEIDATVPVSHISNGESLVLEFG